MKHIRFPSIGQLKDAIKEVGKEARHRFYDDYVYDADFKGVVLPTLKLRGTVKLHGTNAAVCYDPKTDELWFQSRSNILGGASKNMGFPSAELRTNALELFESIPNDNNEIVAIFGEWCGRGVQQSVAISQLPQMFVAFAVLVGDTWLRDFKVQADSFPVFNILDFPMFEIDFDFEHPASELLWALTLEVEKQCPVAHWFGVDGIGEGIVWQIVDDGYNDPRFWFKTKGDEHRVVKTKEKIPVTPEHQESLAAFISATVTDNRCLQGLDYLREQGKPIDITSTGDFIKWMIADVLKEETDTLIVSDLDEKLARGAIAIAAKEWYLKTAT